MTSSTFIHAMDGVVEKPDLGTTRQVLDYGERIMTCRISFEPAAVGSVHSHPLSQTTYIESGQFRVEVDGVLKVIEARDCVYIAPNLIHGSTSAEADVLIGNFSLVKADFRGEASQL